MREKLRRPSLFGGVHTATISINRGRNGGGYVIITSQIDQAFPNFWCALKT